MGSDRRVPPTPPVEIGGVTEPQPDAPEELPASQVDRGRGSLRSRAARGMVVMSAFRVGLSGLNLVRNVGIAAFLTTEEYGLWGLIVTTLITLAFLKQVGISSKYLQQNDADQRLAFQKAFTVDVSYSTVLWVLIVALLPVYALIYGQPEIVAPGLLLSLILLLGSLQAPLWVFYRRMEYFRQRALESLDPVVSAILMIGLAAAGMGYWALVIGALAGTLAATIGAIASSPYPIRLRFEPGLLREYFGFSWPVFLNGLAALLVVQGTLIVGTAALGLAAIGAIGLATNFARFSTRVEQLINRTLYAPICAAQDRIGVLYETFEKSNRIGLMWALPFGGRVDPVRPGPDRLRDRRSLARGADAAADHRADLRGRGFGFSWISFQMARNETRPLAVSAWIRVASFFAITVPLRLTVGLAGYAIGVAATSLIQLFVRGHYLRRMFTGFSMIGHVWRAIVPVAPAVVAVLALRAAGGERSPGWALAEIALFTAVTAVATFLAERRLIDEALGYLRGAVRRKPVPESPGPAPA